MSAAIAWEDCDRCVSLSRRISRIVMCRQCRKAILPQLAQPGWYRMARSSFAVENLEESSPDAKKAIRRNARKFGKHAAQTKGDGLTPSFCRGGCGEPVGYESAYCGPCREEYRGRSRSTDNRPHYTGLKAS